MINDRYRLKKDCTVTPFNNKIELKKGEILTEKEAYNFETECYEDGGEYNELIHDKYGYIGDVGSDWAKENLERDE